MSDEPPAPGGCLPYLTRDLPGLGGVVKRYDYDFMVEELPLYEPCGEGTHTYFLIEKRGLTTPAAIRMIASRLGKRDCDVGYAGLKDSHGITRQMLSVEHVDPVRIKGLELARIRVISVNRHTNKLKLGHLAGNRFDIKIRDVQSADLALARSVVEVLRTRGLPNYFGPQRFGARGQNAAVGLAVLRGDWEEALALLLGRAGPEDTPDVRRARELFDAGDFSSAASAWPRGLGQNARLCRAFAAAGGDARRAWRAVEHSMRRLYISAVQSDLFNMVLGRRIDALDRIETGDVAWLHRNGACFAVQNGEVEQPRCKTFEISPSGPIFGPRMTEATGTPGKIEAEVISQAGLEKKAFRVPGCGKSPGGRRPLRVPLHRSTVEHGKDRRGPYIRLTFELPPGAYATNVTREIRKHSRPSAVKSSP